MKLIYILPLLIVGCATHSNHITKDLTGMQSIALCQTTAKAQEYEKKILAEYGFKRFAHNTYKPLLGQRLFGHSVRAITLEPDNNTIYVAGTPPEFKYHFDRIIDTLVCANNNCQATINATQTLYINKPKVRKVKRTTAIKCTKMAPKE